MNSLSDLLQINDLWSYLASSPKKAVLYGMGDGADKILDVCESKGIKIHGVFASDEFVRYQSFRGFTVKKYSELKEELGDIIILVSFATSLDDVLDRIYNLASYDELYAPDVPVFGTGLFDSKYFASHFDEFNRVYEMLSDEQSRLVFYNVIAYKLTGNISLLKKCETDVTEAYKNIICPANNSSYVDIGAYNGDTLKEYISFAGENISAVCFEPDERNFKKLTATCEGFSAADIKLVNAAAWNKNEELTFYSRSGRNSAHTTAHSGLKAKTINAVRADDHIDKAVDFINIDAEGSDAEAIDGLSETINAYHPTISCAVYHRNEDMFNIPLLLASMYSKCKLYMRHFPYVPAWDTNIYIKYGE